MSCAVATIVTIGEARIVGALLVGAACIFAARWKFTNDKRVVLSRVSFLGGGGLLLLLLSLVIDRYRFFLAVPQGNQFRNLSILSEISGYVVFGTWLYLMSRLWPQSEAGNRRKDIILATVAGALTLILLGGSFTYGGPAKYQEHILAQLPCCSPEIVRSATYTGRDEQIVKPICREKGCETICGSPLCKACGGANPAAMVDQGHPEP